MSNEVRIAVAWALHTEQHTILQSSLNNLNNNRILRYVPALQLYAVKSNKYILYAWTLLVTPIIKLFNEHIIHIINST